MASRIVCFESYRVQPREAWLRQPVEPPPESPFRRYEKGPVRPLTGRQLAHRRRMLEHLDSTR